MLWAKGIAVGITTGALCLPATLAAFFVGQQILSSRSLETTLGEPGVLRAVVGSAVYLGGVGLLGLGFGTLLRTTASAVSALLGVLFGLPLIVAYLPSAVADHISRYLPSSAGMAVVNVLADPTALAPVTGLGVFLAYPVGLLTLAAWRLRRGDA